MTRPLQKFVKFRVNISNLLESQIKLASGHLTLFPPIMAPSVSSRRRKTAILTRSGLQKLETAKAATRPFSDHACSWTLEALSETTGLSTHTLSKIHARQVGVDLRSLSRYFSAFHLPLDSGDYELLSISQPSDAHPSQSSPARTSIPSDRPSPEPTISWEMAPDVSAFCGRQVELETVQRWLLVEGCRLVTILGMVGIGKTWLATKLAEQLQSKFQVIIWRTLQPISPNHAPLSLSDFLDDLLHHLDPQSMPVQSESLAAKLRHLMDCLNRSSCLLVLDNIEVVLQPPCVTASTGDHPSDSSLSAAYSHLFKHLGQGRHQSCVILTSRVELPPLRLISGNSGGIHSLALHGLSIRDIQQIFSARGALQGTAAEWRRLVIYYGGNPLFLGIITRLIQQLFDGRLSEFLSQPLWIFHIIQELLDQQLKCLSDLEQAIIKTLAQNQSDIAVSELRSQISPSISHLIFLENLRSLETLSLLQKTDCVVSLCPFIKEHVQMQFNDYYPVV